MAIVKSKFRVSRLEGEFSEESKDGMSSGDDELRHGSSASEYDYEEDDDDYDSGADSDEFDLLELGEIGEELCQVDNQYCSIPFELYDLPDLTGILSVDAWNNCLTEEERFNLAEHLPAMDQETFMRTMKELFACKNFHFGSPMVKLFGLLKGGSCEPRVALYRHGSNLLQKRRHYHSLQKYQNSMVANLSQVRDAFENCKGYSTRERLQVLNMMRNQRELVYEKMDDQGLEADFSGREESDEGLWTKRLRGSKHCSKMNGLSRGMTMTTELAEYRNDNPKVLKLAGSKVHSLKQLEDRFHSGQMTLQSEQIAVNGNTTAKLKSSKKHERLKSDSFASDSFMHTPWSLKNDALHPHARNSKVNQMKGTEKLNKKQLSVRNSFDQSFCEGDKSGRYSEKLHQPAMDHLAVSQPFRHKKSQKGDFSIDHHNKVGDRNIKSKKWMTVNDRQTGKKVLAPAKVKSHGAIQPPLNGTSLNSGFRAKASKDQNKRKSLQNRDIEGLRGMGVFTHSDETESESSGYFDEAEEDSPLLRRKLGPSGRIIPASESKNANALLRKDKKSSYQGPGDLHSSEKRDGLLELSRVTELLCSSEEKHKGHVEQESNENLHRSVEQKHKRRVENDQSGPQSHSMHDYSDEDNDLHDAPRWVDSRSAIDRSRKKGRTAEAFLGNCPEGSNMSLIGCNSVPKKRKGRPEVIDGLDEIEPLVMERELVDIEPETKPAKPFTLITPTVHTGFSFSIIHLLSAVRLALVTSLAEDFSEAGKHIEKSNERQPRQEELNGNHEDLKGVSSSHSHENNDACFSTHTGHKKLPALTVQEIVSRVKSNPGDPCILETQEPLQDLVRGVLKIFSSKTAPLGAKGWKALVVYEKSSKSWTWIGPLSSSASDPDILEEETSSEAWGLPRKMLVKLVDSFANWLKSGQETLQQIGSLPAPPLMSMLPNLDEKERFRDLRAQKSLTTINPSSEEVRAYFRKEEFLRYSIPDRAFSYTATDGRKSMVAPLRRGGGKPTSKARDHYMLKPDRPPHVTVLCLVRDAAARLPGSIGTRADVCILIRDSQYIVESVTDLQVNQVVSGALDRLHYELDPCVKFDIDRKLWVYLHRDREEEDFEDDGTSSTKKWKRQRKDAEEQFDAGMLTIAYHGNPEQFVGNSFGEYEPGSNVDVAPSSMYGEERTTLLLNDLRSGGEEICRPYVHLNQSIVHQGHPIGWEVPDLNSLRDSDLLCHENPTSDNFDDGAYNRDRHVQMLSASIQ